MVNKGTWVLIHKVVLEPRERASQIPADTKKVPLEMWIKGRLQKDTMIRKEAEILTRTGRKETGTLLEENPTYWHDFGEFMPELLAISDQVRELVFGGKK
ncbi:conserved hypothetical protein [Treponema primitia ZAS-2]|uniref:Uncharacterized protein n=1 Tax=Treponema primitia (strain ATCC BAA-887 / DSM 12427 / ZAS-2) TaxID=545694 RepID=F5YQS8_TREPZ|nr:2-amino-4-oxopentanoate thiolase subunit OrtA [Treponema primitia]AEF84390.1 conserved hypothetical protein [Treponema primitia ZAS-2]